MMNMFLQVPTTYGCLHYSLLLMKATAGCSKILKDHCGLLFMNSHNMSLPSHSVLYSRHNTDIRKGSFTRKAHGIRLTMRNERNTSKNKSEDQRTITTWGWSTSIAKVAVKRGRREKRRKRKEEGK